MKAGRWPRIWKLGFPLLIAVVGSAVGTSVDDVVGSLETKRIEVDGHVSSEGSSPALFVGASAGTKGSWRLEAARVAVNETWRSWVDVGQSPTRPEDSLIGVERPNGGSVEGTFANASAAGAFWHDGATLLVVAVGQSSATVQTDECTVTGTGSEEWRIGLIDQYDFAASASVSALSETYTIPTGHAKVAVLSHAQARIMGDFAVFAWQQNLTITRDGAEHRYWSGLQTTNETGSVLLPRGVVRDVEAQFLRLYVTDGILSVDVDNGLTKWSFEDTALDATGTLGFYSATGELVSRTTRYSAEGQHLQLRGTAAMRVDDAPDGALTAHIVGSLSPENMKATMVTDDVVASSTHAWILWSLATLAVSALGSYALFRSRLRAWETRLEIAKDQLARNPRAALRLSRKLVKSRPDDGEAWFVYAAARMAEEGPGPAARDVAQAWHRLTFRAPLGLLLASGFLMMEDEVQARGWFERAKEDPQFLRYLDDPALVAMRDRLHPRQPITVGYA